ncbi:MAG: M20 family metallo-hydrolase [Vicingus serpentipes]|nr:M20 family metallo-hydrolase [Vicingus serpentipes]
MKELQHKAISLLKQLIETPSLSREEDKTADLIHDFLKENEVVCFRSNNNVWAKNKHFDELKPTILLNSHHDTVKPGSDYTLDPFKAIEQEGKLHGLGSNDAGGCLVSLIATFIHFYEAENLSHNLVLVASAEEEISGQNGIASVLGKIPAIDFGIVGEPTLMDMAVAEKGLMVLDCVAHGKSGHAARNEGENAIYIALEDINTLNNFKFEKTSSYLGEIKLSTTVIQAGEKHNSVPETCNFVVDVRTTDAYTNDEVLKMIQDQLKSEVKARSTRLQPSFMKLNHPLLLIAKELGYQFYGSPTLSDQALLSFPTIKLGPGDSARSHTADEFIYIKEIEQGIEKYIELIERMTTSKEAKESN